MERVPQYDIYDFIDDGVHKSFYSILSKYHPKLNKDFSLAGLINGLPDLEATPGQVTPYTNEYQRDVEKLIKLLGEKTSTRKLFEETGETISDEEFNRIFDELKAACAENSDCKFFVTIKEYLDYARKTMADPEVKPLRDAIVTNAVPFMDPKESYDARNLILKSIYLSKAEEEVRKVNHMRRDPGQYPEWDELQFIRSVLQKKGGLREYDDFYDEASVNIREAALRAMEKERISTVCRRKRRIAVKEEMKPSMPSTGKQTGEAQTDAIFDRLKRNPEKNENSWTYDALQTPELLCDLSAEYSENGIENQRVIAFRYGKLKYQKPNEIAGFNVDNTYEMPELIGVSRIGKDGTKTYFVLMQPIDRLTFRPKGEKPVEPGEKPYGFVITEDVKVPTSSGRMKVERQTHKAEIVDPYGTKMNAFMNREIPEQLKEFYAKVFFSDEYLESAQRNNARYIGSVVETEQGPKIKPSDIGKANLAAAHYAAQYPGLVNGVKVISFEKYCSSGELDMKQFSLIHEYETKLARQARTSKPKKDDGAR